MQEMMVEIAKNAKAAAPALAVLPAEIKNQALLAMAQSIRQSQALIQTANDQDVAAAKQKGFNTAFLDRLAFNAKRIEAMAESLEIISQLPDPLGKVQTQIKRPNGLDIIRISVPIGVIGVIYESRPNVTADAAGLCLKSGNAVILRGGSESFYSATAIIKALHTGLAEVKIPAKVLQFIPTTDRAAISAMLKMDNYIDVIIPRGGPELIKHIVNESRIPLFKHLAGLCHTYIHHAADLEMARKIVLNAKMRRTGICGATEVLLIDATIIHSHLPLILDDLIKAHCEVRGDQQVVKLDSRVKLAADEDYATEFLDAIIAVKVVNNLAAAINHVAQYGTHHTDAIITADETAALQFLKEVDSAIVMHNTSTQFADGGEFGMGAEMGIATGKLHARGPVGAEQLTTFKYLVRGEGQIRA